MDLQHHTLALFLHLLIYSVSILEMQGTGIRSNWLYANCKDTLKPRADTKTPNNHRSTPFAEFRERSDDRCMLRNAENVIGPFSWSWALIKISHRC